MRSKELNIFCASLPNQFERMREFIDEIRACVHPANEGINSAIAFKETCGRSIRSISLQPCRSAVVPNFSRPSFMDVGLML